jgi:glycosyltransferase involved in cell wall biosynthesis
MDGLIGISKYNCGELRRLFQDKPIRRLPHIFNSTTVAVEEPRRPALASRPLHFAYLGRIDAGKRPDRLVAEWRDITLAAKLGAARLDIYGAGDANIVGRIKELIRQQDLGAVVAYRGPYDASQLDAILTGVDVVLHPSQWEGLGLVPLEAMQRGVPVVATEADGTAELGEENPDAVITRGEDWDAFRAGIGEMVARLRAGAISSARLQQWVEARYGQDALCRKWREALLNARTFFNGCP